MSKKNKKKNYQKNKKTNSNNQQKKILDGVDLGNNTQKKKEIKTNPKEEKHENQNKFNLNEHIQTFVSVLFSGIIFIALGMLIFVLYNNYIKKNTTSCTYEEVCKDLIKKDYKISEDKVMAFLMNLRGLVYNIEEFDKGKVNNNVYLDIATYLIWNMNTEYELCDNEEDSICLVTKKEKNKKELIKEFDKYFNLKNINLVFYDDYSEDDKIRLYEKEENVVLTFSEFEYQTLKHDLIDIRIDEDKINILFALSEKIVDSEDYKYVGYKDIELKYIDNNFVIENVKTSLK